MKHHLACILQLFFETLSSKIDRPFLIVIASGEPEKERQRQKLEQQLAMSFFGMENRFQFIGIDSFQFKLAFRRLRAYFVESTAIKFKHLRPIAVSSSILFKNIAERMSYWVVLTFKRLRSGYAF